MLIVAPPVCSAPFCRFSLPTSNAVSPVLFPLNPSFSTSTRLLLSLPPPLSVCVCLRVCLPEPSDLQVNCCQESYVYVLSAVRFATVMGCKDCTVVIGAAAGMVSRPSPPRGRFVGLSRRHGSSTSFQPFLRERTHVQQHQLRYVVKVLPVLCMYAD